MGLSTSPGEDRLDNKLAEKDFYREAGWVGGGGVILIGKDYLLGP
jgi:hypothetical protein